MPRSENTAAFWESFLSARQKKMTKEKLFLSLARKGFRKVKKHPTLTLSTLAGTGLTAAGAATAVLSDTPAGKSSAISEAQAKGHLADHAEKLRSSNPVQYLLNPVLPGPMTELHSKLQRRHYAAAADHPYASNLIPFYSVIKGGPTGLKTASGQGESKTAAKAKKPLQGGGRLFTPKKISAGLGLAALAVGAGILGRSEEARKYQRVKAEAYGHRKNNAKKMRENYFGHYILNPVVDGPLTEGRSFLERKKESFKAERPLSLGAIAVDAFTPIPSNFNPVRLLHKSQVGVDGIRA